MTKQCGTVRPDFRAQVFRAPVCATIVLILCAGAANAQTIGVAATVRNEVAQMKGAASAPIDAGEEVVRNEVIRTGPDSATKLVFRDDTNLAVGPVSTVTLDRFVFAGDGAWCRRRSRGSARWCAIRHVRSPRRR